MAEVNVNFAICADKRLLTVIDKMMEAIEDTKLIRTSKEY